MKKLTSIVIILSLTFLFPVLATDQEIVEERQHQINTFIDEDEFAHFDLIGPATVAMSNMIFDHAFSYGSRFVNDQFFRESVTCSIIIGRLVFNWIVG